MMTWNSFISMVLVYLHLSIPTGLNVNVEEPNPNIRDIPVINLNVYMMGRIDADAETTILINENIDFLNQEFEGQIEFVFDQLFMDHGKAYLPDLHKEYMNFEEASTVKSLLEPIEIQGAINVFLFDTYTEEGTDRALMGFTPRLKKEQEAYAASSPVFDRIFMAYEGLENKTTLVHEMGHFLGLHHPWELNGSLKYAFGIRTNVDESQNHMSYGSSVCKFTPQQLESMRRHAMKYRQYLMERVVRTYAKS